MAKTIKSFSLDDDVAKYLEATGNASGEVNTIIRRHMLNTRAEQISGQHPSPTERQAARAWARAELDAARRDVEAGAYDDIRQEMGWAA
jgi:negative regulator of replication initiation